MSSSVPAEEHFDNPTPATVHCESTANLSFSNPQSTANSVNYNEVCFYRLLNDASTGDGLFSSRSDCETAILASRGELLFQERVAKSSYDNFLAPFIEAQYAMVYEEQPPRNTVVIGETTYSEEDAKITTS